MSKTWYVYILTNRKNGTLYVGVTSDLRKRMWEHKNGVIEWFTKKYGIHLLVYFESFDDMYNAISREKALKWANRITKKNLIESNNPEWNDLYENICE